MALIQATLRLLHVAPPANYCADLFGDLSVLGGSDLAIFIAGPTGVGKSTLAALAQQHFGCEMDSRHLPGSWQSTANALEDLAFQAKDALLVVDDFVHLGMARDGVVNLSY